MELQRFCCGCGISQKGLNFSVLLFNKYKVIGGGTKTKLPLKSSHVKVLSNLCFRHNFRDFFSSLKMKVHSSWFSTLKSERLRPKYQSWKIRLGFLISCKCGKNECNLRIKDEYFLAHAWIYGDTGDSYLFFVKKICENTQFFSKYLMKIINKEKTRFGYHLKDCSPLDNFCGHLRQDFVMKKYLVL